MYARLQILLDVIDTWRLNAASMMPDPTGLTWTERMDGSLQVDYAAAVDLPTLDIQITFFDASGVAQDIDLSAATSLSSAVEIAATALATTSAPRPFLTADWTLREMGTVIFGAGSFTAIIGGTGSQKELESIFTSLGSTTASGGPPAAATATISSANPDLCVTSISVPGLQFDSSPMQQFPIGTATFEITEMQQAPTIGVVATFDGTSTASITVDGVPTGFVFDWLLARSTEAGAAAAARARACRVAPRHDDCGAASVVPGLATARRRRTAGPVRAELHAA